MSEIAISDQNQGLDANTVDSVNKSETLELKSDQSLLDIFLEALKEGTIEDTLSTVRDNIQEIQANAINFAQVVFEPQPSVKLEFAFLESGQVNTFIANQMVIWSKNLQKKPFTLDEFDEPDVVTLAVTDVLSTPSSFVEGSLDDGSDVVLIRPQGLFSDVVYQPLEAQNEGSGVTRMIVESILLALGSRMINKQLDAFQGIGPDFNEKSNKSAVSESLAWGRATAQFLKQTNEGSGILSNLVTSVIRNIVVDPTSLLCGQLATALSQGEIPSLNDDYLFNLGLSGEGVEVDLDEGLTISVEANLNGNIDEALNACTSVANEIGNSLFFSVLSEIGVESAGSLDFAIDLFNQIRNSFTEIKSLLAVSVPNDDTLAQGISEQIDSLLGGLASGELIVNQLHQQKDFVTKKFEEASDAVGTDVFEAKQVELKEASDELDNLSDQAIGVFGALQDFANSIQSGVESVYSGEVVNTVKEAVKELADKYQKAKESTKAIKKGAKLAGARNISTQATTLSTGAKVAIGLALGVGSYFAYKKYVRS